jgi:hypothetical protein
MSGYKDVRKSECFLYIKHQGLPSECQLSKISGSRTPSCFSRVQEKLVNSMTQEDFEPASCPEDEVSFPLMQQIHEGNIRGGE